jgi:hypothetical protein
MAVAHLLLAERPRIGDAVRLLGIGVSNDVANEDERRQLCLPLLPLKEERNGAS